MRNLLAITLTLLFSSTLLGAEELFKEYTTKILSIDGRTATIKDSDDIFLGSSGIVSHKFDEETESIVARVDVIKKDGDEATLRFEVFSMLAQDAFPKPGLLPSEGDTVRLNYLYDRSLIVAPNYDVYKEVTKHFDGIEWVHPDIPGAYLAKRYRPNPDRELFQEMCSINSASLIFFALNNEGRFVDCHNFKTIKKFKAAPIKKAQAPFYTRVKNIDTTWFIWDSAQITDYNRHYKSMIR